MREENKTTTDFILSYSILTPDNTLFSIFPGVLYFNVYL